MTPLEVVLIVLLTVTLIFLVYFGLNHFTKGRTQKKVEERMENIPYTASFEEERPHQIPQEVSSFSNNSNVQESVPQPVQENNVEPEKAAEIPATTPEELAEPEPLQRKVSQKVEQPASFDQFEKNENQALFGDNLRHPEAMITKTDNFSSLETDIASGIANKVAVPDDLPKSQFGQEMVTNGGEFMAGINAFDVSESKSWFSNI